MIKSYKVIDCICRDELYELILGENATAYTRG